MISKSRFQGYAALLATFVLGAVVGAGGTHTYDQRRLAHLFRDRPAFEHRRLEALARRLDLDEGQREAIRKVMEDHGEERRALIRNALQPCSDALHSAQEQLDAQIRAVLRPDQAARFDALSKEHRERWLPGPAR